MQVLDFVHDLDGGGVELFIVAHTDFEPTEGAADLLRQKVRYYLDQINSDGFQAVFKNPPRERTLITVATKSELPPNILAAIDALKPTVSQSNATLQIRVCDAESHEWLCQP